MIFQPVKYFLTYKNKRSGQQKEYQSPDYPFNDSVWMAQWEFVSQRETILICHAFGILTNLDCWDCEECIVVHWNHCNTLSGDELTQFPKKH